MKEEQETGFVHDLGLGKRESHADKAGQALTQRVVPTLNMGGFSRLFAHGGMLLLGDDSSIHSQKVRKAMALAIRLRNRLPQPLARLFAPIPNSIRHHLSCLAAQSYPNPGVVRFFEHKRPEFVQFQDRRRRILWVGGDQSST